ncbi:MAG TPA: GspH/FimT family pseudopilin [Dongiaceae bacterium]|nr:GspH/FimT family pseudopilin [Dongiaceae bacterium]
MNRALPSVTRPRSRPCESGFSLLELVVALLVALILSAIAIPSIITAYNHYRLGNQATLIASQLDLLRFNAVRKNTTMTMYATTVGGNTVIYIDANKNGTLDPTDPQITLPADILLIGAGTAPPSDMPASTSMGAPYATVLAFPTSGIVFNSSGTVGYTGASAPYLIGVTFASGSKYGYRAVTVTPMGEVRVWTAEANGSWSPTS